MEETTRILDIETIHASYGKKAILHGLSLSVNRGSIAALIGPNGAGKSTLLKVIAGILAPQSGKVFLDGEDVTNLSPYLRVKKGIGYFIQGGEIFPSLTVWENLSLGGIRSSNADLENHFESVFKLFPHLRELRSKRAGLLSGGQRQALALGIILMQQPKILLLDEPSAGLAPFLAKDLIDKVKEINFSTGVSVLLVEQNINHALRISDHVYLLKNGNVVGEGTPGSLLEKQQLENVFFA